MKIEKVNDNQIRCTLTKEDLANRQIKLSELAYGSDKAKDLFHDMMQQASYELGFEADDIPLMIEAIPLSTESIILIVTKVEYPEELDTRFSKFSDGSYTDEATSSAAPTIPPEAADSILGLFRKIKEELSSSQADSSDQPVKVQKESQKESAINITKLFVFRDLDDVIRLSHVLKEFYESYNVLYKDPESGHYLLVVTKGAHTPEDFNKVCNILCEYGRVGNYTPAMEAYFTEHYEVIVPEHAVQVLGTI